MPPRVMSDEPSPLEITLELDRVARELSAGRAFAVHAGINATDDVFYAETPEWISELSRLGVLNVEMESSALFVVAAINVILLTWTTVLDARHTSALARALGATPQQVSAGLSAARAQTEAAMAQRGGRKGRGGGAPANAARSIPSRPGVPIPLDSPLYTSFMRLKEQASYHVVMNMQSNDPKVAEVMAQGTITPAEFIVQGNTRQYSMHMKIPATDEPGTIEDWEIRAVVQNGQAVRLLTSPAVSRDS